MSDIEQDPNVGMVINGYKLQPGSKSGKIGSVYKAVRTENDFFACKIIEMSKLQPGWQLELEKVHKLKNVDNVIEYKGHGSEINKDNKPVIYIFWNFIEGLNLKEYAKRKEFDLPFVYELANVILNVLYACKHENIVHGDLHEGNILISNPDPRRIDQKRTIWVADFGFGGSHNAKQPKDDIKQLHSIILNLLTQINPAELTPEQKILHEKIQVFFNKRLLEQDPTQQRYVGKLDSLIKDFQRLANEAEREAARAKRGEIITEPGDYLVAEALGHRAEEWKNLFVPEFLAAKDLLSRNITVLTGARGCGKTMTFRRLTTYMDAVIGEQSGVVGSDQFIGFYLNSRSLIEAFPYIPNRMSIGLASQITHFFHLSWFAEICRTFSVMDKVDAKNGYSWLEEFVINLFPTRYEPLPVGANVLAHIRAFVEHEKERTRTADFGKDNASNKWPLARRDFLDILTVLTKQNLAWAEEKPFYFFLDDYTIPTVPRSMQAILNPIIFKRRDNIFFKISTESSISFERITDRNKPLELHQDFELIDLASESLHQDAEDKRQLLESIFTRRIERDDFLKGKSLTLGSVLGKMAYSNNELAKLMRDEGKKRRLYSGVEAFVGMWSSDIRIMIQMFVDMLRESQNALAKGAVSIPESIQDKVYRNAGGEFLDFAENVPNPSFLEKQVSTRQHKSFGSHLKDIVEAFINVSRYELTTGKLVSNEGRQSPKQAFRLEILDHFELEPESKDFYEGLIRWHIFLQDRRGKSVRGMLTPRLFLNRVLLPYAQLTFSTHDHLHVNSKELNFLFKEPQKFLEYWKKKKNQDDKQGKIQY
jgi:hypothetical protein